MQNKPTPGSHWRHYKSKIGDDRIYEVIDIAYHSETDEVLILYKPLYEVQPTSCIFGKGILARPIVSWYENIIKDGIEIPRFIQIS